MKIIVRNRKAVFQGDVLITHNNDYKVQCVFDDEWDSNNIITAIVVRADGKPYEPIILDNERCFTLPMAIVDGVHYVGFTADNVKTTTPACFNIVKSIKAIGTGDVIPEPSPSVYQQIIQLVESIENNTYTKADVYTKSEVYNKTETDVLVEKYHYAILG